MKPENQQPKALKAKAWKLMSELVRRKYADQYGYVECYTCGCKKLWNEVDAGHGIGGRGNYVLFLEELIKPQCKPCNGFRGGMYEQFLINLCEDYGFETVQEWAREARKPFKRSKADYVALVYELQARLDDLV